MVLTTEQIGITVTIISLVGNGVFLLRMNNIKSYESIVKFWKEECEKKDYVIKEMMKKKNVLKQQFHTQLVLNKKIEGELKAYKEFNGHKPLA